MSSRGLELLPIYLVDPNTTWMDAMRAGHFSGGWLS